MTTYFIIKPSNISENVIINSMMNLQSDDFLKRQTRFKVRGGRGIESMQCKTIYGNLVRDWFGVPAILRRSFGGARNYKTNAAFRFYTFLSCDILE